MSLNTDLHLMNSHFTGNLVPTSDLPLIGPGPDIGTLDGEVGTFVRQSDAWYFDSNGNLKLSLYNALESSNDMTNTSYWITYVSTITKNLTDPFGKLNNAYTLTGDGNTNSNVHNFFRYELLDNQQSIVSVYVKHIDDTVFNVAFYDNTESAFAGIVSYNISSSGITVQSESGGMTSQAITSVGSDGWYRLELYHDGTAILNNNNLRFLIYPAKNLTYTQSMGVYGPQIEPGKGVVHDFVPTPTLPSGPPRFNHRADTTYNWLLRSRSFDTAPWALTTATLAAAEGYDGGAATGWEVIDSDGNDGRLRNTGQMGVENGAMYHASFYIKKDNDETRFPSIQLYYTGGTPTDCKYQINTKTGAMVQLVAGDANARARVIDKGAWWKFQIESSNVGNNDTCYVWLRPADGTTWGATSAAATGSVIADQFMISDGPFKDVDIETTTTPLYNTVWRPDGLVVESEGHNALRFSRSLNVEPWVTDQIIPDYSEVGLDGEVNTACVLEDDSAVLNKSIYQIVDIPDDTETYTASMFVKKDTDTSRFSLLRLQFDGGTTTYPAVQFSTATGEVYGRAGASVTSEDYGDWWKFTCTASNNNSGNTQIRCMIFPAIDDTIDGGGDVTITGSIIVDQPQLEFNKSYPGTQVVTTEYGPDVITNGTFDTDSDWTKNTGWSISGGKAHCDGTQPGFSDLSQGPGGTRVTEGKWYRATIDVTKITAGYITLLMGNLSETPTAAAVAGTYTWILQASGYGNVYVRANAAFVGSVDNFVVEEVIDPNYGLEMVTNGDFSSWTGDDPDGWTVANEDANNYVTEHVDGAQMISDNTASLLLRHPDINVTVGATYEVEIDADITTNGYRPYVQDSGGQDYFALSNVNFRKLKFRYTASGNGLTQIYLYRSTVGNTSVVFTSVKHRQVFETEILAQGDRLALTGANWGSASCSAVDRHTLSLSATSGSFYLSNQSVIPNTWYEATIVAEFGTVTAPKTAVYDTSNGAFIVQDVPLVDGDETRIRFKTPNSCNQINYYAVRTAGSTGTMYVTGMSLRAIVPQRASETSLINQARGASWPLADPQEILGPQLFLNPTFANWTGDDPDDWTISGESGVDPMVTEVVGNVDGKAARMYTTGNVVSIGQSVLEAGKTYRYWVMVKDGTLGQFRVQNGGEVVDIYSTAVAGVEQTGKFTVQAQPDAAILKVIRQNGVGTVDFSFDYFYVREVLPQNTPQTVTDIMTGQFGTEVLPDYSFDDASEWSPGTGWTVSGGGTAVATSATALLQTSSSPAVNNGTWYKIVIVCSAVTGGTCKILSTGMFAGTNLTFNTAGTHTFYNECVDDTVNFAVYGNGFSGVLDSISITPMLVPPQGTLLYKYRPMMTWDDMTDDDVENIMTAYDGSSTNLGYLRNLGATERLQAYAPVQVAAKDTDLLRDVQFTAVLRWGSLDGNNHRTFQYGTNESGSLVFNTVVQLDSLFEVLNNFSLCQKNIYGQTLKGISFYNTPLTDGEIGSLL